MRISFKEPVKENVIATTVIWLLLSDICWNMFMNVIIIFLSWKSILNLQCLL